MTSEEDKQKDEPEIWFPLMVREEYKPFQYAVRDYLNPSFIRDSEEECKRLCDELNKAIFKPEEYKKLRDDLNKPIFKPYENSEKLS